jgi:hypothetical protein
MSKSIDDKIRERLKELEDIKIKAIEKLKIQQELVMKPIETAISELEALLPEEEKAEKKPEGE